MTEAVPSERWWGRTEFSAGQIRRWQVGPSVIWAERQDLEWRLYHHEDSTSTDTRANGPVPVASDQIGEEASMQRFAVGSNASFLTMTPLLADRPVVVRPETPFYVPSGEDITLYVSTPLWIRFEIGPPQRTLTELPAQRPSDTWFGPSTLVGELCYASRTSGRLRLDELPQRPHRAVTPVRIRNNARDTLLLERVKVPVQYLALYRWRGGSLWTQAATLVREQDGDLAALQIGKRAPSEASGAERVSPPRQVAEGHLALRAFSRLFGGD